MSGTLAICSVPDDVQAAVKKFRFARTTTVAAILLKVDKQSQTVVIDETFEDTTLDELQNALPPRQPRYLLLSYAAKHQDGRTSYPMALIYYIPPDCNSELMIMYAGSRNNLIRTCDITKNLEVRDAEDLTLEFLDSKLLMQ